METHCPSGVPFSQLYTWSHALLAADMALDKLRACTPFSSGYHGMRGRLWLAYVQTDTLLEENNISKIA